MIKVFIALGSNLEPEKNIPLALARLETHFPDLTQSPIYRCEPVGFSGHYFWNLVATFSTSLPLLQLAEQLRALEFELGRAADAQKNAPRTIDIDILLYDNLVGQFGRISLPREDILKYAFVLKPLADLAPGLLHPQLKLPIAQLYQNSDLDFSALQVLA